MLEAEKVGILVDEKVGRLAEEDTAGRPVDKWGEGVEDIDENPCKKDKTLISEYNNKR